MPSPILLLEYLLGEEVQTATSLPEFNIVKKDVEVQITEIENEVDVKAIALGFKDVYDAIRGVVHEQPEIPDWARYASATNYLLAYSKTMYDSAGGELIYDSNDAYIPGVWLEDYGVVPETGYVISDRGNYFVERFEDETIFAVPIDSRAWLPGRRHLIYHLKTWGVQWNALLLKYKKFVKLPMTDYQYAVQTVWLDGAKKYMSVPFVGEFSTPLPFITRFKIGVQTLSPVDMKIVITNYDRTEGVEIPVETLNGSTQYELTVPLTERYRNGYLEIYADGARHGPTILYVDVVVGAR